MEITLIRHGKPAFELKGRVKSRDVCEMIRRYDSSGIAGPPEAAKQRASACKVAVCSDFIRSLESAKALGFNDILLSDPIFREIAVPHFKTGSFAMSASAWGVLLRYMSVFGFSQNGESLSMAKKRAQVAASALIDITHIHESVLLVGHGFINYFLAKELLSRSWTGPSKPGNGYWEYGVYQYHAV
ncbi:histidine phosphatase family protein [Methylobacter sp. YRD-M1]|uniref:histidine phosphatase family protein n=1 Tax=Methylobacter sp. YRD-M1 TaxID=2911520 RepID=UPI00227AE548|nr:phosphoglycerate mutase family protein [Methylobacter sp. YRD-M1]WAK02333.1 histidine phosphatase family protein [Methylobacter sp. YRD-M1]